MNKLGLALFLATIAAGASAQLPIPGGPDEDKAKLTAGSVEDIGTVKAPLSGRNCVTATGTHLVRKGACVNAPGRSYDRTDIERTGARNTGAALVQLETAINLRGP